MPCDRPSSKKQLRWAFAAEERGELPKGTARRWARKMKKDGGKANFEKKVLQKLGHYLVRHVYRRCS